MNYAYQPQVPTLPPAVEAAPTSWSGRMGAGDEPPETYPNGQPHESWDASGNYFWPYIPDEYERMIYHEVDMRFTESMEISPEPKPVWPEGDRPLAPHWYPGGYVLPKMLITDRSQEGQARRCVFSVTIYREAATTRQPAHCSRSQSAHADRL